VAGGRAREAPMKGQVAVLSYIATGYDQQCPGGGAWATHTTGGGGLDARLVHPLLRSKADVSGFVIIW
jgi:hypothetical protein